MLLLRFILAFCCEVGCCWRSLGFRANPGDDIIFSSESPSDNLFAAELLCFSHKAYELKSGFTSEYVCVSDKLPSFNFDEPRLAILKLIKFIIICYTFNIHTFVGRRACRDRLWASYGIQIVLLLIAIAVQHPLQSMKSSYIEDFAFAFAL